MNGAGHVNGGHIEYSEKMKQDMCRLIYQAIWSTFFLCTVLEFMRTNIYYIPLLGNAA